MIQENLREDTSSANAPNIETTDENLSINQMYQETKLPSLGKQIFSVLPLHGPTGALFNIKKQADNSIEIVRNEVEVYNSNSINTGITDEAIQDILSQFGKNGKKIIGRLLRGLSNEDENTKTLAFLDAKCKDVTDLTLSSPQNAESNYFEITQKIHELVLQINSLNTRSFEAFAVIPYTYLAGIVGLKSYIQAKEGDEQGIYVGKIGLTKFYMNPNAASTKAYVGIMDEQDPTKSSAVFSPYTSDITEGRDPDTGQATYFIFNRYAITASPLHVTDNEMLYMFDIVTA